MQAGLRLRRYRSVEVTCPARSVAQIPQGHHVGDLVYARVALDSDTGKVPAGGEGLVIGPSDPYNSLEMKVEFGGGGKKPKVMNVPATSLMMVRS